MIEGVISNCVRLHKKNIGNSTMWLENSSMKHILCRNDIYHVNDSNNRFLSSISTINNKSWRVQLEQYVYHHKTTLHKPTHNLNYNWSNSSIFHRNSNVYQYFFIDLHIKVSMFINISSFIQYQIQITCWNDLTMILIVDI